MAGRDPSIVIVTPQMSGFDLGREAGREALHDTTDDNEEVAAHTNNGGGEGYHDPEFASIQDNFPVFTSFQDFTTDKSQSFNVNIIMENRADVDITIHGDLVV